MSYQHHWVVVYDEDWGAFMVDAETTATMSRWSGTIYNKTTGHWEFPEEESDLANEYDSLEEVLAYNLTRLDLTAGTGQDTTMSKKVKTYIAFEMSADDFINDEPMTDEEMIEYAKACFLDDIYSFVKYDELMDVISAEIIND